MDRRGEDDRDDRERGSEGRGMEIGELMLSLFGGDDDGLMLSEEPRRERRLLPLSFSSIFSFGTLTQGIFSGMLCCVRGGAERRSTKRGGGGRAGGQRDAPSVPLGFWPEDDLLSLRSGPSRPVDVVDSPAGSDLDASEEVAGVVWLLFSW